MKTFAKKVREQRAMLGLSQRELALKSGLSVRTITGYESGLRFPHAAPLYKLAKALEVSTEYLKRDDLEEPETRRPGSTLPGSTPDLEALLQYHRAILADPQRPEAEKESYFRSLLQIYLDSKLP